MDGRTHERTNGLSLRAGRIFFGSYKFLAKYKCKDKVVFSDWCFQLTVQMILEELEVDH